MNFQVDHNVLAFWFFIFLMLALAGFFLFDYYKDDKKKVK